MEAEDEQGIVDNLSANLAPAPYLKPSQKPSTLNKFLLKVLIGNI